MRETRFETLILVIGGAAILGSLALSLASGGADYVEVVAQLMLFAVLAVAVYRGRRAGLIAAVVASVVYIGLRAPLISASGQISMDLLVIMVARLASFGLVGIVGGDVSSHLKYVIGRLQDSTAVDEWSLVYSQNHIHRSLVAARGRLARYGEPFSVVVVTISESVMAGIPASGRRSLTRGLARHLTSDIRMVDEVARLDDGRFVVMLPHTPKEGGEVVARRQSTGVVGALGASADTVSVVCLGGTEDSVAIDALVASIEPPAVTD